jgi:hypothetical protein
MAQGWVLRAQPPERGMYLAFQREKFSGTHRTNPTFRENFFTEMLKKLDYERFLGYTSTGFESGGGFPFERGMVIKAPHKGNKREGFRFRILKFNQGGDSE